MFQTQLTPEEQEIAERLTEVFEAQDENCDFVFPDEEVRRFLPALLLSAGVDPNEYSSGPLADLFVEFRTWAGVPEIASAQDWVDAACEYYKKQPPNPELLAAVQEVLNS
ncbi:MAG: hypothetical protein KC800_25530 [Candidatus Eremiobacteraeota bacterium]|nr:hypothetical protein [Candidatus Eremiobacteraeota bacterium]